MTIPTADPDNISRDIRKLDRLSDAYIDASSMILCNKAGILDLLASVCTLHTVESVLVETGYDDAPVTAHPDPAPAVVCDTHSGIEQAAGLSEADLSLLCAAAKARLPLVSDDRALLQAYGRTGSPCFNALMMLNLLCLRRVICLRRAEEALVLLLRSARYHPDVISYANALRVAIMRRVDLT